jgi:hypothetical protein
VPTPIAFLPSFFALKKEGRSQSVALRNAFDFDFDLDFESNFGSLKKNNKERPLWGNSRKIVRHSNRQMIAK